MHRLAVLRRMRIDCWRSAFFHTETLIGAKALGDWLAEIDISHKPRTTGRQTGARPRLVLCTV
jgi:hypothetical protein